MSNLLIQKIEKTMLRDDLPEIKPGYTVRVHQKIKEGEKERVQIYEGLVIAISHGHGHSKTITVRKIVQGIGVEKIFSLQSPNVVKIEAIRIGKVRRAKLYYMRNVSGKAARLKEILVSGKIAKEKQAAILKEKNQVITEPNTEILNEDTVIDTSTEDGSPVLEQATIEEAPVEEIKAEESVNSEVDEQK